MSRKIVSLYSGSVLLSPSSVLLVLKETLFELNTCIPPKIYILMFLQCDCIWGWGFPKVIRVKEDHNGKALI